MSGRTLWKFALTAVVVGWSLLSIFPTQDTPFPEYVRSAVTVDPSGFETVVEKAQAAVDADTYPSLFVALSAVATEDDVDLSRFFPEINLADIPKLETRNDVLVGELLKSSKGKIRQGLDLVGGVSVTFRIDPDALGEDEFLKQEQLSKAVEIMRNRLDGSGVAEPLIRPRGSDQIEIQLPGLNTRSNPDLLSNISKPAKLELRLVSREQMQGLIDPYTTPRSQWPAGYEVLTRDINLPDGRVSESAFFVKRISEVAGSAISEAFAAQGLSGGWEVQLRFSGEGEGRVFEVTSRIVNEDRRTGVQQPLAIVLDGDLYSAPVINEPLSTSAVITGDFSQREAIELANVLNNPLEVKLIQDEVYEVGPTLAKEAQDSSKQAMLWGAGLVIIFMVLYYWAGGVVAVFSGIVNILIVLGVLASFQATLTLPGVAALVLTLGMGVDANILIFERIREELKQGKALRNAVHGGFEKAFSTIVDANITTLITAAILIALGTGPVKGFGVTLAIGIVASVFAALIASRGLLEFLVEKAVAKRVLGLPGLPIRKVPFMNFRRPAFIASWILVVVGVAVTFMRADEIFGIDFLGGDEVVLSYVERPTDEAILSLAQTEALGEIIITEQTDIGTGTSMLKIQTDRDIGPVAVEKMQAAFPDAYLEMQGITTIGAAVSEEIQRNGFLSVAAALLGILTYVALRFEFGYGLGAIVATIHDVLMTIGLFVIFGGQFTAPMLAAILMIVGYSINDTIVVFDRIREELGLDPDASLKDIVHLSINRVLSRTIWTSLSTLLAAGTLLIFGAGVIQDFALVFVLGILTGTFSSIFIATPVFFWYHKGDRRHVEDGEEPLQRYDWEVSTREARPGKD
ncbi:MAG: protein translocase subunit SecD [Opitutales bacterium]|nr:protein translocase subunit SecD [Opitutales bacterium]NRA26818.1 protein translocase subunit SecD [Opitutales bacterium]